MAMWGCAYFLDGGEMVVKTRRFYKDDISQHLEDEIPEENWGIVKKLFVYLVGKDS